MSRTYYSRAVVGPGSTGFVVAWMSNQLCGAIPQWPRLRVVPGQRLSIAIDPQGGRFGLKCDGDLSKVQVTAVIEPDEQLAGKHVNHLLPFPPFQHRLEPLDIIDGRSFEEMIRDGDADERAGR